MDGLIPRNPAAPVKPPRPRREEIRPLGREQIRALLKLRVGDHLEALYIWRYTAGLRRGELQGLKWDDVDLEAGMLQVRRTFSEPKGGYIFRSPQQWQGSQDTAHTEGYRALRSHRKRQLEERMESGRALAEHGLVFPSASWHSTVGWQPQPRFSSHAPARRAARRAASTTSGTRAPRSC